jgi:hypothetical protein
MHNDWTAAGRAFIAELDKEIPANATLKERRKFLHGKGWRFHGFTSWGKKVWSKVCREYLEKHGLAPKTVHTISQNSRLHQRMKSGDIVFPFRGEQKGGDAELDG